MISERALHPQQVKNLVNAITGRIDRVGVKLPIPLSNDFPRSSQETHPSPMREAVDKTANRIYNFWVENALDFRLKVEEVNAAPGTVITSEITVGSTEYLLLTTLGDYIRVAKSMPDNPDEVLTVYINHPYINTDIGYSDYVPPFVEPEHIPALAKEANDFLDGFEHDVLQRDQSIGRFLEHFHSVAKFITDIDKEGIIPITARERKFQTLMLYYFLQSGRIDTHTQLYIAQHKQTYAGSTEQLQEEAELHIVHRFLDKISARYNESHHPLDVSIGAEIESTPANAQLRIEEAILVTSDTTGISVDDIDTFLGNMMEDDYLQNMVKTCIGYRIQSPKRSMQELIAENEFIENEITHIGNVLKSKNPKSDAIAIIEFLYHWYTLINYPQLEHISAFTSFTYESPFLLTPGNTGIYSSTELNSLPVFNDELIAMEYLALIKLGELDGSASPHITVNVLLNKEHTELMDASALWIASGLAGVQFTNEEIQAFVDGRDFYYENFPKASYLDGRSYYISLHKKRIKYSDKGLAMVDYVNETTDGGEARIFKNFSRSEEQVQITQRFNEEPHFFGLPKNHWHHKFKKALRFYKLMGIAITAAQNESFSPSTQQTQLGDLWHRLMHDWQIILDRNGIENVAQDQRYVSFSEERPGVSQRMDTPYNKFITQLIVATHRDPALQEEIRHLVLQFQNDVEYITQSPKQALTIHHTDHLQRERQQPVYSNHLATTAPSPLTISVTVKNGIAGFWNRKAIKGTRELLQKDPRLLTLATIAKEGSVDREEALQPGEAERYGYIRNKQGKIVARIGETSGMIEILSDINLYHIHDASANRTRRTVTDPTIREIITEIQKNETTPLHVLGLDQQTTQYLLQSSPDYLAALKAMGRKTSRAWIRLTDVHHTPLQVLRGAFEKNVDLVDRFLASS